MNERDGQAHFDFLFGNWRVAHRRLRQRLAGSDSWEEFEGTCAARPVWGGLANTDEMEAETETGRLRGAALRLYEPKSGQWRIYWATPAAGVLDTPMVGRFENGRGEFFCQDLFDGRAVFVRFIWSGITATTCHWEQAFSADGGRTWETNWTMDLTRVDKAA